MDYVKDKRSLTSKENGKKGGRPSGVLASSTIQTQIQRRRLVELLEPKIATIFEALAKKAEQGDVAAAKELFDRAWGKSPQSIDHTTEGKALPRPLLYTLNNALQHHDSNEEDSGA